MVSVKTMAVVAVLLLSHVFIITKAQEGSGLGDGPRGPPGGPEGPEGPADGGPGGRPAHRPRPPSSSSSQDSADSSERAGQQRLFFGSLFSTRRVSCDYSTQAGASCASCSERLICTRAGGFLTTCRGFLPHCTDGRCSFRESDACAATATAAATTTQVPTTQVPTTTMAG